MDVAAGRSIGNENAFSYSENTCVSCIGSVAIVGIGTDDHFATITTKRDGDTLIAIIDGFTVDVVDDLYPVGAIVFKDAYVSRIGATTIV